MWNFKIGRSFGLMFQTLPFIALRTAVYFGCSLLLLIGCIGGPVLGALLVPESMWHVGAWMGFAVGALASGTVVYFLREYFLYLVKAGHIAVLVELMEGRALPSGKGQFAYAKDIVSERFVEASAFFVLDQVITGILGVVNRVLVGIGSIIPGMEGAMSLVGTVLKTSLTFADEVILALSFRTRSTDVWRTSRDGVVLYAQNYKNILKNAFFLALLNYALVFVFFLLAWAPAAWIAGLMPGAGSAILSFLVTVLLVYSIKKAFIEPLLMTALMQVYFRAIEGQIPNPAWVEKLDGVSEKFRGMKEKFVSPESSDARPLVPANVGVEPASATAAGQWPAQQTAYAQPVALPPQYPQASYAAQPANPAAQYPQAAYAAPPANPAAQYPQASYAAQPVNPAVQAVAHQPPVEQPLRYPLPAPRQASSGSAHIGRTTLPMGFVKAGS
jgi:hypothetical protein